MKINGKIWSAEEDNALQRVLESYSAPYPWKDVARQLRSEYNLPGKNFKDCRQRWQDHAPQTLNYVKWSQQQQLLLLYHQSQIGNRWFQLSYLFPGRKDTFVKNQFYSIFRKALKKANTQIYTYYNNKVRPITRALVLKMLDVIESKFNNKRKHPEELKRASGDLKEALIGYLYSTESGKERVEFFLGTVREFRRHLKESVSSRSRSESVDRQEQLEQPHFNSYQDNRLLIIPPSFQLPYFGDYFYPTQYSPLHSQATISLNLPPLFQPDQPKVQSTPDTHYNQHHPTLFPTSPFLPLNEQASIYVPPTLPYFPFNIINIPILPYQFLRRSPSRVWEVLASNVIGVVTQHLLCIINNAD